MLFALMSYHTTVVLAVAVAVVVAVVVAVATEFYQYYNDHNNDYLLCMYIGIYIFYIHLYFLYTFI